MNNTVYVIEGTPKTEEGFGCPKISSEGYSNLENAIQFIESRTGQPQRLGTSSIWYSSNYKYRILFINIRS